MLFDLARLVTHFRECPVRVSEGAQTPVLRHVLVATQGACHPGLSDEWVRRHASACRKVTERLRSSAEHEHQVGKDVENVANQSPMVMSFMELNPATMFLSSPARCEPV